MNSVSKAMRRAARASAASSSLGGLGGVRVTSVGACRRARAVVATASGRRREARPGARRRRWRRARASRPCARPARARSPGRARSRRRPAVELPRWKRSKISSRSCSGTPGPCLTPRSTSRPPRCIRPRSSSQAGRRAARCRSGSGRSARPRRDRLSPSTAAAAGARRASRRRRGARRSNSAATARHSSPSSSGSAAQLDLGVEAAEVEQVAGQRATGGGSAPWRGRRARARPRGRGGRREVVVEQLEHAVQRGQRRAQLVRGGRDERPAGGLLAAQARCIAANVRVSSPISSRPGRLAAPRQAPRSSSQVASRSRSRRRSSVELKPTPSSIATSRPTRGGLQERVLHGVDGRGDVGQARGAAPGHSAAADPAAAGRRTASSPLERRGCACPLTQRLLDAASSRWGCRRRCRGSVDDVQARVEDRDLRVGGLVQRAVLRLQADSRGSPVVGSMWMSS